MESQKLLSDLTIEEFTALMRETLRELLETERSQSVRATESPISLLDIPPLSIGAWQSEFSFIRREDYYDDEPIKKQYSLIPTS
jgi:hypothetical protein